jgi:dolichyl-phosphate beta-glucosyltransferase
VNDGSTDGTADVVEECNRILLDNHHHQQQQQQQKSTTMMLKSINCLSLAKNEGKGSAISRGLAYIANQTKQQIVLLQQDGLVSNQNVTRIPTTSSTRHWVLVADADGSGDIRYLNAMLLKFDQLLKETTMYKNNKETKENRQHEQNEDAMLIGNRMDKSASPSRRITRWGFQTMVKWICGDLQVRDTQCGMKLMTLDAGLATYSNLHLQRWTHDVEVLYRARELNIPVTEMDVGWEDKDGSKLVTGSWVQTIWVSGVMLMEVIIMRVQYMLGRWKVEVDMEEGGGSGAKE